MVKFDTKLTFSAGQSSPGEVVATLRTHGCCLIRGAHDRSRATLFRDRLAELYAEMDRRAAEGTLSEDDLKRCHRYGILRPLEHDEYTLADGTRLADHMIDAVLRTPLVDVVRGLLGPRVSLLLPTTHTRRQQATQSERPVPFHQDSAVMRLHDVTVLNFWFPLDPCGRDAPSVEFVPWSLTGILPHGDPSTQGKLYGNLEISEEMARAVFNLENTWHPELDLGDVLLLTSRVVHRTYTRPGMRGQRRNFEIRFAPTADLPREQRDSAIAYDIAGAPTRIQESGPSGVAARHATASY